MLKKFIALVCLFFASYAGAHCPAHYKPEKVCLMLDQNTLYIYGEKNEHNGPYQDLKTSSIESIKAEGMSLKLSRLARGVFRIEHAAPLKKIDLELINDKKKTNLRVELQ